MRKTFTLDVGDKADLPLSDMSRSTQIGKKNTIQSSTLSKPREDTIVISGGNVAVVCRFRPLNDKEKGIASGAKILPIFVDSKTVEIPTQKGKNDAGIKGGNLKFVFDRVFGMNCEQEDIYAVAALPIVESVLEGFNGTIFAYGQTSSGKTHTMQGVDINDPKTRGIVPRIVTHIFDQIDEASEDIEFTVKVSMIEIYMERIRDLLDPKKINLQVHESKDKGVFIDDVTETYVTESIEVEQIMKLGNENRSIGVTDMNKQSSRSHSCFIMTITQNNSVTFTCKTGKLYLVDLAGSEKIAKTGATGQTLDEAKKINKSLSTLGLVINNLTDGKSTHIPYRDSKLTRILQESLGGNSKTCLIITCSPSVYNEAETISTLRFGQRAKKIQNKPKINKELSVAELKHLLEEAELTIEKKEKRIKLLEKLIQSMGGNVPEEKDDFIQRRSTKEDKFSPSKRNINSRDDEEEANAKIDMIENAVSSDDDMSDSEEDNALSKIDHVDNDDIDSNIETENSEKPAKHVLPSDDGLKSDIEALSDTLALLEENATETKDAETMTEQVTYASVKTNTNTIFYVNEGTSIHFEYLSTETMTEEHQMQSSSVDIQTDEYIPVARSKSVIDRQSNPAPFNIVESKDEPKNDFVERIEEIEEEYKEIDEEDLIPLISKDELDSLYEKHTQQLNQKEEELNAEKNRLAEVLKTIEEQKKILLQKGVVIFEQQEEIETLTKKIKLLEHTISEELDRQENSKEEIDKYKKTILDQSQVIQDNELLVSQHAEKLISLEKDLKSKDESNREKSTEISKLKSSLELEAKKYKDLNNEYVSIRKQADMLVEKCASLNNTINELENKIIRYKKQLHALSDQQKKNIEITKEIKTNYESDMVRLNTIVIEKEKMIQTLIQNSNLNADDINKILKENISSLYSKETVVEDTRKLKSLMEEKEEIEKELSIKTSVIKELEEKYSAAKHKIHEMKNEIIKMQQKKAQSDNKKYKEEKTLIVKALNDKNKKIEGLEKEIESYKIKISGLENFMGDDQKQSYVKLQTLTKNMNQLKQMYAQMVRTETTKQEIHILEKKIKTKDKKITKLEDELSKTREQVSEFKDQIHMLLTELNKFTKVTDEKGNVMLMTSIDLGINTELIKQNKGIVKSRKGGKTKNPNNISFKELMKRSTLNKYSDNDTDLNKQFSNEDEIKELDEEDEEEHKLEA